MITDFKLFENKISKEISIKSISKKLDDDYICVYDNYNYPEIKLISLQNLDLGTLLKSFNDPDNDYSSFYLYENYILWERRSYTRNIPNEGSQQSSLKIILYMKKDKYKKLKANDFNI